MEGGKFVSSDKKLEAVLEQVRSDRAEAEKFAANPQAYLQAKGVSTEGMRFTGNGELSEKELETVAGGAGSICASVGCIACATVGGDIQY